jgi:hypothetical protein
MLELEDGQDMLPVRLSQAVYRSQVQPFSSRRILIVDGEVVEDEFLGDVVVYGREVRMVEG